MHFLHRSYQQMCRFWWTCIWKGSSCLTVDWRLLTKDVEVGWLWMRSKGDRCSNWRNLDERCLVLAEGNAMKCHQTDEQVSEKAEPWRVENFLPSVDSLSLDFSALSMSHLQYRSRCSHSNWIKLVLSLQTVAFFKDSFKVRPVDTVFPFAKLSSSSSKIQWHRLSLIGYQVPVKSTGSGEDILYWVQGAMASA